MVSEAISSGENLGRGVFSSSHSRKANGGFVPFHVFLEKEGEPKISVDRLDLTTADEATSIADGMAGLRNRNFYGWAVVSEDKAQTNERRVEASPLPGNPYHADIILPSAVARDRKQQKRHAVQLAAKSTWRKRHP